MKSRYLKAGSFIFFTGHSSVSLNFKNIFHLWLNRAPSPVFQTGVDFTEMCGVVFVSQWFSDTFSIKVRGSPVWEQWAGVSGEGSRVGEHRSPCCTLPHPPCDAFCLHLDHQRWFVGVSNRYQWARHVCWVALGVADKMPAHWLGRGPAKQECYPLGSLQLRFRFLRSPWFSWLSV